LPHDRAFDGAAVAERGTTHAPAAIMHANPPAEHYPRESRSPPKPHATQRPLSGLTSTLARARLAEVGRNELPSQDRRTGLQLAGSVVREPMLLLLLLATALYWIFGDLTEAAALGTSVLAIIAITILQERRSERALDALRELASPRCRVLRDGDWRELDVRDVVPGDVVHIGEGDRAPADALLREGSPLTVDESLLTGESVPVVRTPDADAASLGRPGEVARRCSPVRS
jgi:Ca2+-transporting ATPase